MTSRRVAEPRDVDLAQLLDLRRELQPLRWVRGPARLAAGEIILDRKRAELYEPGPLSQAMWDLTGVHSVEDAIRFVGQHGFLRSGPDEPKPQESFESMASDAYLTRLIVRTWMALSEESDYTARVFAELREQHLADRAFELPHVLPFTSGYGPSWPKPGAPMRETAKAFLAGMVSSTLGGSALGVRYVANEELVLSVQPSSLNDLIGYDLAILITTDPVNSRMVRECELEGCGRLFAAKHGLTRHCSPTHADRARQRRHRLARVSGA